MYEFSLDQATEKISDGKTKSLMREVLSGYYNENYRSSSVMLWTVVICDLVFKMRELKDIYLDSTADDILKQIAKMQEANPSDSSWELRLVDLVSEKTKLISSVELQEIKSIQKYRHLSAHPILNSDNILYRPTREITLANIRIAMDYVLCRQALLSKSIFDEIMTDIESTGPLLPKEHEFKQYLIGKYYGRLSDDVAYQVFKSLWRVSFASNDDRAKKNRGFNYKSLRFLYEYKAVAIRDRAIKERSYFTKKLLPIKVCPYYVYLVGDHVELYDLFETPERLKLKNELDNNISCKVIAYFLHGSIINHIENTFDALEKMQEAEKEIKIPEVHLMDLLRHSESANCVPLLCERIIKLFSTSYSYDNADTVFDCYVCPVIDKFSMNDIRHVFKTISENGQIADRRRAQVANNAILTRALILDEKFDVSVYDKIRL